MQQIGRFRFEVIEHTADKAIIAFGKSFEEMLESAAAGMFAQQAELTTVRRERKWAVSAEGESAEDLLVAWLRELIVLAEKEAVVFCDFKIKAFAEWKLEAEVWGAAFNAKVQRAGAAVKAVTYHNLSVRRAGGKLLPNEGNWEGKVTFDV